MRRHLLLLFPPHDLVGRDPLGREALGEPRDGRRDSGVLLAQPLDEPHREGTRQRPRFQFAQERPRIRERLSFDAQKRVADRVGLLAGAAPLDDAFREAPQVLDEHDSERDRDRPELADRQEPRALVGADEPAERLRVEPAVGVLDEGPGQAVDARIALERAAGELGQLAVEARRQVLPDLAELILDDVEVVHEPLGRGRDRSLFADRARDRAVGGEQDLPVLLKAGEQEPPAALAGVDRVLRRQALRELLEALGGKELARIGSAADRIPDPVAGGGSWSNGSTGRA